MVADAQFQDPTADHKVEALPLAHVSMELGQFSARELRSDPEFFRHHFRSIAPWAAAARAAYAGTITGKRPRISTCVLIDDYFGKPDPPRDAVPALLGAARDSGLDIDYIARWSGCAGPGGGAGGGAASGAGGGAAGGAGGGAAGGTVERPGRASLARLVQDRLVELPAPNSTGVRRPVIQTGWLSNGQRPRAGEQHEAMKIPAAWRTVADPAAGTTGVTRAPDRRGPDGGSWHPPAGNGAANHSIYADIELWNAVRGDRVWSCAMLAAVWQLLRLGMLRDGGRQVAVPRQIPAELPEDWAALPPVARVSPGAAPFSAYRTLSICAPVSLPVEHAVRTILERVAVDPAVLDQVDARSGAERVALPPAVVDRIEYLIVDPGPVRGAAHS